jgi:hypothetical protein
MAISLGRINSTFALSLFARNYKFNVSRNSKGYCYTEQNRCDCGNIDIKNGDIITDKVEIINLIDFNKISKQHEIKNDKEFSFLLDDIRQLPSIDNKIKVFFYDTVRELIWEKLKYDIINGIYDNQVHLFDYQFYKVINEVLFMDIDLVGRTVTFSEITYKEGDFTDCIIMDFDFVNEYLDLDRFVEIVRLSLPDKEVMTIQMILHTNTSENFDNSKANFLFDQPLFISCFTIPDETTDNKNDFLTITKVFSSTLWKDNFGNFMR